MLRKRKARLLSRDSQIGLQTADKLEGHSAENILQKTAEQSHDGD